MAKTEVEQSETGNWNVAQKFTEGKIMRWLTLADEYEFLAEFGQIDIEEEIATPPDLLLLLRIKALYRLAKVLDLVCENSIFAIQNTKDKKQMDDYWKEILKAKTLIGAIQNQVQNRDKTRITINEEVFSKFLDLLTTIKKEMLEPMNRNDLIFIHKEQFDPKEYKQSLKDRL